MKHSLSKYLLGLCIILVIFMLLLNHPSIFVEQMKKAENIVFLRDLVPYEWDEVRIYRRPMDTQFNTPDYKAIYQYDSKFTITDGVSLLVFYNNYDVVGYETYPSYQAGMPQFFYSDGISLIEYAKFTCDEACFSVACNNSNVQWILKTDFIGEMQ